MNNIHPKLENLMHTLVSLDRYPNKTKRELMDDLGISRATIMRLIQYARRLGVRISYDRLTTTYHIISWGVFDRGSVYKWCRYRIKK